MNTLGELEQAIMEILWQDKPMSTRTITDSIRKKRSLAYTTVATILNRLYEKGFVTRNKHKNQYKYTPLFSKNEYIASLSNSFLKNLLSSFGESALPNFVKGLEKLPKEKKEKLIQFIENHEKKS